MKVKMCMFILHLILPGFSVEIAWVSNKEHLVLAIDRNKFHEKRRLVRQTYRIHTVRIACGFPFLKQARIQILPFMLHKRSTLTSSHTTQQDAKHQKHLLVWSIERDRDSERRLNTRTL